MELLLILAGLYLLGEEDSVVGEGGSAPKADDWDYDSDQWRKVSQGFSRQLAWRVYQDKTAEIPTYELAWKTPEGLFSQGEFRSQEAAEAKAKTMGAPPE